MTWVGVVISNATTWRVKLKIGMRAGLLYDTCSEHTCDPTQLKKTPCTPLSRTCTVIGKRNIPHLQELDGGILQTQNATHHGSVGAVYVFNQHAPQDGHGSDVLTVG